MVQATGDYTIKYGGFAMYRFHSKLVCSSKLVCLWLTIEKTQAYSKISQFSVNYESVQKKFLYDWLLLWNVTE